MTTARTKRTMHRMRDLFLEELRRRGNISDACRAAEIPRRQTVYEWRHADPEFAVLWDEALDVAIDAMEREAHRRAFEGTEEPIIGRVGRDRDDIITHVTKYSDSLAQFLLKAHRPEKYREKVDHEHRGSIAVEFVNNWREADA
jgi:hypothetical protein